MKIGIVGTGLIGGSLAASLVGKQNYQVFCYNRREDVSKQALKLGVVDGYFTSIEQLLKNTNIIIFATPLNTYGAIAAEISAHLTNQKIISDVGSVKFLPSEEVLNNLPTSLQASFVPAHPIAGSEKTGVEAADKNLFIGKKLIITKLPQTDNEKANIIAQIWRDAGAEIIYLEPKTHDEIYAKVSHLPQLLSFFYKAAFALHQFEVPQTNEYKEFTRLCNSSEDLWVDIFKYNKPQIFECLQQYKQQLITKLNNINLESAALKNIPQILAQSLEDIIPESQKQFGGTGLKSFLTPLNSNLNSNLNSQFQTQEKSVISNFINEFIKQIEAYEKASK